MQVPLGYALALAASFGAPVRVAGPVMASLAVATRGEDLLGQFLGDDVPRPGEPREPGVPRFAPRNLAFTDGLAGWEFGGSFRDEPARAADYACAAEAGTAVLASAAGAPEGFAALAQSVLAHEYVGRTVTFRAEVRTEGVMNQAGLHLLGGMPTGPVSLPSGSARVLPEHLHHSAFGERATACSVSGCSRSHGPGRLVTRCAGDGGERKRRLSTVSGGA